MSFGESLNRRATLRKLENEAAAGGEGAESSFDRAARLKRAEREAKGGSSLLQARQGGEGGSGSLESAKSSFNRAAEQKRIERQEKGARQSFFPGRGSGEPSVSAVDFDEEGNTVVDPDAPLWKIATQMALKKTRRDWRQQKLRELDEATDKIASDLATYGARQSAKKNRGNEQTQAASPADEPSPAPAALPEGPGKLKRLGGFVKRQIKEQGPKVIAAVTKVIEQKAKESGDPRQIIAAKAVKQLTEGSSNGERTQSNGRGEAWTQAEPWQMVEYPEICIEAVQHPNSEEELIMIHGVAGRFLNSGSRTLSPRNMNDMQSLDDLVHQLSRGKGFNFAEAMRTFQEYGKVLI